MTSKQCKFKVVYAEDRGKPALLETDFVNDVISWADESPMSHQDLEVYISQYGWYIKLEAFLKGELALNRPRTDNVNHPSHYTAYKGVEVIDLTEQMNFNRGNAVKYIARAGLKDPSKELEDLEKALWYIKREISRIKETHNV